MASQSFSMDGSDWYLSGINSIEVVNTFDYVVDDLSMIKFKELEVINQECVDSCLHYLTKGGRELLLEPLLYLQPRSHNVLEKFASKYQIGFLWESLIPAPHLPKDNFIEDSFFEVKGRLIFISSPIWSDRPFGGDDSVNALPEVLANSWLKHGAGWGIGPKPTFRQTYRQLIGNPQNNWCSLENVLFSFDPNWSKTNIMDIIKSKVPDVYVTHYNPYDGTPSEWCSMRCFLDTRPYGLDGKCGDQFFVVDSRTDKIVYHIHNGDVANLRVLEPDGVGEAMDAYCAHTLLRTEGRFNFLPWSRLL